MIEAISELLYILADGLQEVGLRLGFCISDYMCGPPYFNEDGTAIVNRIRGFDGTCPEGADAVLFQKNLWLLEYWGPAVWGKAPEGWGPGEFGELNVLLVFFNKAAAPFAASTGDQVYWMGRLISEVAEAVQELV